VVTDPVALLRAHRNTFKGSTAQYAKEILGKIERAPSGRTIRRWLSGQSTIPPEITAWLQAQAVGEVLHDK